VRCGNVILAHLETAGDAGCASGVATEHRHDSRLEKGWQRATPIEKLTSFETFK